jgi:hypothetical protein
MWFIEIHSPAIYCRMRASTVIEWEDFTASGRKGDTGMGCVRTKDKWGLCMSGQKLSSYRPAACRCGCASGGVGQCRCRWNDNE